MPGPRPCLLSVLAGALCLLGGCAAMHPNEAPAALRDPHLLPLFAADGAVTDFDALVSRCAGAQAVLIGEIHGHPQGLDFAAALWDGILSRTDHAALSMEFFERDQQAALDDYLGGITDEAAFKKASGRTPAGYPPEHRRMVEAAKAAGRPVLAANASRRYVHLARTDGYDRLAALTPEQRRLFDLPGKMPAAAYHDRFIHEMQQMGGAAEHASSKATGARTPDPQAEQDALEGFYRSQVLWDSTMGASIARALDAGLAPVVHVVGALHVENNGGTLQMLRRRSPDAAIITIAVVDADSTSLRAEDRGKADYVVYVGLSPEPARR